MAGTNLPPEDSDYVSVEEGAADLREFVKANGFVTMQIVLLDQYWKTPLYAERFQGNDATSIFARTGLVVGMPSNKLHEFEQFLATQKTTAPSLTASPSGNGFTTMTCACNSPASTRAVSVEIAEGYAKLGIPWQCHRCRDLERRSRLESTIVQTGRFTLYGGLK